MKIKGVIFDMDGLLLDTEKLYVRFWCEAANYYGFPMQKEHALNLRSLDKIIAEKLLKQWFGQSIEYVLVRQKRIELMDKYIEQNSFDKKPGANEILLYLRQNNYKTALATATPLEKAKKYLEQVSLINFFDEIISARMVKRGKPNPDIYLLAAKKLGLKPNECLALEDSPNGIESAYSAGCVTVMIPDLDNPNEKTTAMIYKTAKRLLDVTEILQKLNG